MCSIIGIISQTPVRPLILEALKRLEYRGYDSAGICVFEQNELKRWRSTGTVEKLECILPPFESKIGIGHTRWATHGEPIEKNAHPHMEGGIALVHNGIIENFAQLKAELKDQGYQFSSDTDTEVMVHLFGRTFNFTDNLHEGIQQTLALLKGSFAIAVLLEKFPNQLIVARSGSSPLAIGKSETMVGASSDALGLMDIAKDVYYLDEDNWAILSLKSTAIFDFNGNPLTKKAYSNPFQAVKIDRETFDHYMLKEIHEQPKIIQRLIHETQTSSEYHLKKTAHLTLTGCGTAFYACWLGKYFWEYLTGLPANIELASESHYLSPPMHAGTMLAISQSGETADTIKALHYAKSRNQHIASIVNVPQSSIDRFSSENFYTHAGPEIGVASTKAFSAQIFVLLSLFLNYQEAFCKKNSPISNDLEKLVPSMNQAIGLQHQIKAICTELCEKKTILFLGRGFNYPLALEGALKMKELSYIHAEGIAAGELKHGSIALIDKEMTVIAVAPFDRVFEKTLSNLQEVSARGGKLIVLTDEKGAERINAILCAQLLVLPSIHELFTPLIYCIPLQLIAYYTALLKGCNIDQPRNLAKSVTVE